MAKLVKVLPKDVQARVAKTRIVLEDARHTSVIKTGETFYHRYTKRYHYIYDVEGSVFYSYEVDTATADYVLTRSTRSDGATEDQPDFVNQLELAADNLSSLTGEFIKLHKAGRKIPAKLRRDMAKASSEVNRLADIV